VTATALERHLCNVIVTHGPLTMARYMAEALGHPEHGYYMTRDPFGAAGDFITAPEISQIFGELIGAWCADVWMQMGAPPTVHLVELGPGRGTLMKDALRATQRVPGFHEALRIHLVETSPRLRETQATSLEGQSVSWHDTTTDVPEGPLILIANELFDALPVHQFQFTEDQWHERLVEVSQEGAGLRLVLDPAPNKSEILRRFAQPKNGAIAEVCPAGVALVEHIVERVVRDTGAALIIDYGHAASGYGDTMQGVRDHATQSIFEAPGMVDLCAHVDFAALAEAGRAGGATIWGPVSQSTFLSQLGINARAATLTDASPTDAKDIAAATHRLTHADEMGTLFKVLSFSRAPLHPAGFDPRDPI
jgi:NADH dehydrogenase [ubiquinone] 1 alpha subcomplex assembly factor 7